MKTVYIAHPYGGKVENKKKAEKIILKIMKKIINLTPVSPIHAFGFAYDEFEYEKGMAYCLSLLAKCDELWLFGDWENSKGCNMEKRFAEEKGIPIRIWGRK